MELSTGAVPLPCGISGRMDSLGELVCENRAERFLVFYSIQFSSLEQLGRLPAVEKKFRVQVGCQINVSWPRPCHHPPLGAFLPF